MTHQEDEQITPSVPLPQLVIAVWPVMPYWLKRGVCHLGLDAALNDTPSACRVFSDMLY